MGKAMRKGNSTIMTADAWIEADAIPIAAKSIGLLRADRALANWSRAQWLSTPARGSGACSPISRMGLHAASARIRANR